MRILTADQYAALDRPNMLWVVEGLIPAGVLCVLLGEPFAGKSYLALQLAFSVARGEPFLGHPTTQGNVLYVNLDAAESSWRNRLNTLKEKGVDTSGPMCMLHPDDDIRPCDILSPGIQARFRDAIKASDPKLIIIDVLRELHNKKEESSTDMKLVVDQLLSLTHNRALVVIHHTTKISNKEMIRVIDLARGSSYLAGKAETVWCLLDDALHIVPRFAERQVVDGHRLPNGFWSFPTLAPPAS